MVTCSWAETNAGKVEPRASSLAELKWKTKPRVVQQRQWHDGVGRNGQSQACGNKLETRNPQSRQRKMDWNEGNGWKSSLSYWIVAVGSPKAWQEREETTKEPKQAQLRYLGQEFGSEPPTPRQQEWEWPADIQFQGIKSRTVETAAEEAGREAGSRDS